jgi:predicted RecB family endonuclease
MLRQVVRVFEEELRRAIDAIVAIHHHIRELDEQALRTLGVLPREPRR